MKHKIGLMVLMVLMFFMLASTGFAASTEDLERKLDLLSDEVDDLKSRGFGGGTTEYNRVTVHGYGEMHFQNQTQKHGNAQVDNHRFVIGVHAVLADWIHLNAEIDFEHAAQTMEYEFGYLDFLLDPALNVRAGVILAPIGFLNEYHEPPLFWTTERPLLQQKLIPTSWNQAGAGIFGTPTDGINYRLYFMNSLQSVSDSTTTGQTGQFTSSGIRDGRSQLSKVRANDFSIYGRAEFTKLYPGLQLGFSLVHGDTTHDYMAEDGTMTLIEADIRYRKGWFDMNASIVNTHLDDAAAINTYCVAASNCTATNTKGVAENMFGFNVQTGAHLPQLMGWKTSYDIIPHVMFERIRNQDKMPNGTAPTLADNYNVYHVGVAYLPIPEVSIKVDHLHKKTDDGKSSDTFYAGLAYMY